jgi:hypothetical protein
VDSSLNSFIKGVFCACPVWVKTRLSHSILSKIACWSNTITLKWNLIQLVDIIKLCTQFYFHNFFIPFKSFGNFFAHG